MKIMKKLGFNIVLLGMIASGKDTQAKILEKKYELKLIESGIYWRKLMKDKGPDGEKVRKTTGQGRPAPVYLMKKFLIREIAKKPKNKDLLFLGNPRLKPEAQLLKKILSEKKQDFISFYIDLPEKEVYKRSQARKKTNINNAYKVLDTEKIIKERIKYHKEQVSKTVKYLKDLKKMTTIKGKQSIPKVTKDIVKVIENYTKTKKLL